MRERVHGFFGDRQVSTPFEVAAWIVALLLLTLVLRTNQVLADSSFFFVAHAMSPRSLILIWMAVVGLLLLMLTGILSLTRRFSSARAFDMVATGITLAAGAFCWETPSDGLSDSWPASGSQCSRDASRSASRYW